jgi:organizing structure protein 2
LSTPLNVCLIFFSVLYVGFDRSYFIHCADRVKAIISPNESLTPGLLYVGIATLTGSIIARNRTLPIRFLLPPIFLVASANHFLPETTGNLSSYFGSLEETYFPFLSAKHNVANAHTRMTWERVKDATASSREQLNRGAMSAVEKVQEVTGLKMKETFGWTSEKVANQKHEIADVVHDVKVAVDEKLEAAENKVEKTLEEVKTHI